MDRLTSMLAYKRPHDSASECDFIQHFLEPYAPERLDDDALVISIATSAGAARTLFSSHVDTVHTRSGQQTVHVDADEACLFKRDGEPLGADDGAGVWLMLEMIDAGVPGTYVFHRGEEWGGLGSRHLARTRLDWLRQFDRAIAFDRRGDNSVITHQRGLRCCSDRFAKALGASQIPVDAGSP